MNICYVYIYSAASTVDNYERDANNKFISIFRIVSVVFQRPFLRYDQFKRMEMKNNNNNEKKVYKLRSSVTVWLVNLRK